MKFAFLEKRSEPAKAMIAMLLAGLYIVFFMMLIFIFRLNPSVYFFLLAFGILLWLVYSKVANPQDKSMLYIIAVLFSSILITVTNLSHDELQKIVGEVTLSDYVYIKIMSNFIGWIFLPICAVKLSMLVETKENHK